MTCGACENTVRSALLHLTPTALRPTSVQRVPDVRHTSGLATVIVQYHNASTAELFPFSGDVGFLEGGDRLVAALDAVGFDARVLTVKRVAAEPGLDDAAGAEQGAQLEINMNNNIRYVHSSFSCYMLRKLSTTRALLWPSCLATVQD
jgi:hypothetical protein